MREKKLLDADENTLSSGTPWELESRFNRRQQGQGAQDPPPPGQPDDSLAAFTRERERKKTTVASSPGTEYCCRKWRRPLISLE